MTTGAPTGAATAAPTGAGQGNDKDKEGEEAGEKDTWPGAGATLIDTTGQEKPNPRPTGEGRGQADDTAGARLLIRRRRAAITPAPSPR